MSYETALEYIHSVKWTGSKPGLSRTRELLTALGNPEKKLKFVHIAGTDGKGSTAACISSVLREAGYRTGLYISPYITRFNERMQINGEMISDEELSQLTEKIRPAADAMEDSPTEFEIITALAMEYFLAGKCDIVVLETGLGGELDSTNVIPAPETAVITALGLDHVKELGPDLSHIAQAKAGIIKPGSSVVFYGMCPEGENVIRRKCADVGAELSIPDYSELRVNEETIKGCRFDFGRYKDIRLPLAGTYQPYNAAVAITALERLRDKGYDIPDEAVISGLGKVKWPGRFEVICEEPLFILDGAHNPHGMAAARDSIEKLVHSKKTVMLTGVMADKNVEAMMDIIAPCIDVFVTVTPHNPRAMPAEKLAERLKKYARPVYACASIEEGVRKAVDEAGKNGAVCALGSLYFSADVRAGAEKLLNIKY